MSTEDAMNAISGTDKDGSKPSPPEERNNKMDIKRDKIEFWLNCYYKEFHSSLKNSCYKYRDFTEYTSKLNVFFHMKLIATEEWKTLFNKAYEEYKIAQHEEDVAIAQALAGKEVLT